MNPFVYPKSRHLRRERPGRFSTHSEYKPFLQREFSRKCVYCRVPDSMKGYDAFGVDHYRPKSVFGSLVKEYSNLFYACNTCNRLKGDYWPPRGKGATHFIPNPCDHEMFKHLRFRGAAVESRTTAGRVTEELLDLNDPEVAAYRNLIIDIIAQYESKKAILEQTRNGLKQLLATGSITSAEADPTLGRIDDDLAKVNANLIRLCGD